MYVLLLILFMVTTANAQEITKIDDDSYTKTEVIVYDIAEKQNECGAIEAQANALIARLDACWNEVTEAVAAGVKDPSKINDDGLTVDDIKELEEPKP